MSFASTYGPWAVVAGASDGVGEAFAHEVARRGLDVVLIARRRPLLESIAERIERDTGARPGSSPSTWQPRERPTMSSPRPRTWTSVS